MSKKVITKTVEKNVKQYTTEHPELNRKDVYKLIKEGTLKAHKGYKGAWVIEDVVSETIEVPDECPSKGNTKKRMPSKKSPKTYSTKEFLESYNKKHPRTTITLAELRLMLINGVVNGEKVNGKWVIHQSPSRRVK